MNAKNDMRPVHPGEILRDELDDLGLSADALSRALGVPLNRVTMILNGQRGVSADTALRLARYFGTTPELWLNLQQTWELRRVEIAAGGDIVKRVTPRSSGRTAARSRRFSERYVQSIDLVDRFEAEPSSTHARNALAAIGRLQDDGAAFWKKGFSAADPLATLLQRFIDVSQLRLGTTAAFRKPRFSHGT